MIEACRPRMIHGGVTYTDRNPENHRGSFVLKGVSSGNGHDWGLSAQEPSEGPLYEWFRVFLDADAMGDDQLIEVP